MSATIGAALRKGENFRDLLTRLGHLTEAGRTLSFRHEDRTGPYLDHDVAGWVDGPPTSTVAWVLSGADPAGGAWRRFTVSRVAPWTYELQCFPTPFANAEDPLSPGVPPSARRART